MTTILEPWGHEPESIAPDELAHELDTSPRVVARALPGDRDNPWFPSYAINPTGKPRNTWELRGV